MLVLQAALAYIIKSGVDLGMHGAERHSPSSWKKDMMTVCTAGLLMLALAMWCMIAVDRVNSYPHMGFS